MVNAERLRLDEADTGGVSCRRWGPYLSERQWGTVREDYGSGDDKWSYFSHEQARSRAYRWGQDALWFRHTWSWAGGAERPSLHVVPDLRRVSAVRAKHSALGTRWLCADQAAEALRSGGRGAIRRAAAGGRPGAAR